MDGRKLLEATTNNTVGRDHVYCKVTLLVCVEKILLGSSVTTADRSSPKYTFF